MGLAFDINSGRLIHKKKHLAINTRTFIVILQSEIAKSMNIIYDVTGQKRLKWNFSKISTI